MALANLREKIPTWHQIGWWVFDPEYLSKIQMQEVLSHCSSDIAFMLICKWECTENLNRKKLLNSSFCSWLPISVLPAHHRTSQHNTVLYLWAELCLYKISCELSSRQASRLPVSQAWIYRGAFWISYWCTISLPQNSREMGIVPVQCISSGWYPCRIEVGSVYAVCDLPGAACAVCSSCWCDSWELTSWTDLVPFKMENKVHTMQPTDKSFKTVLSARNAAIIVFV